MNYDSYLASCTERYVEECFCEPKEIDGTYNCRYCDNEDCEFWSEHNG